MMGFIQLLEKIYALKACKPASFPSDNKEIRFFALRSALLKAHHGADGLSALAIDAFFSFH
jgi:hypothetical protein